MILNHFTNKKNFFGERQGIIVISMEGYFLFFFFVIRIRNHFISKMYQFSGTYTTK